MKDAKPGSGDKVVSEDFLGVILRLEELKEDATIPRNVKAKIDNAISALKNGTEEMPIRKDRAIQQLDEAVNDTNTQSYTRAQIWNIVSVLESL